MITIGKIQGMLSAAPAAQPNASVWAGPVDSYRRPDAPEIQAIPETAESKVRPPRPEPAVGRQFDDPRQMSDYRREVAEAIDKASVDPHLVGFRQDPETHDTIIEIRSPDGTLITQFQPENVLNLHRQLDELSGMVIDQRT
jgi:uncharacterized FlaG/YvyC family protein